MAVTVVVGARLCYSSGGSMANVTAVVGAWVMVNRPEQPYRCERGLRPGSVGGLQAPTNWILSRVIHVWSDVR